MFSTLLGNIALITILVLMYLGSLVLNTVLGTYHSISNLKESFIIFICTFDPFNHELPCYTFKSICKENTAIELNDKTSKI